MRKTGNQQVLKEMNKSLLLNLIYERGPISRIELARLTKLSPTTVSVLIEEKIREGVVHEVGTSGSGVGRKMTLLSIRPDFGYVLGVDLSNYPARCVLLNFQGELIAEQTIGRIIGKQQLEKDLPEAILRFLSDQKIDKSAVRWAGISLPGRLDDERERILHSAYLKLENYPMKSMMEQKIGLEVYLVNDLEAACFAEQFSGNAKGVSTLVYVLIGYGIGAGLVINHQIYRGTNGEAGRTGSLYEFGVELLAPKLRTLYPDQFPPLMDDDEVMLQFMKLGLEGTGPVSGELEQCINGIAGYCGTILQFLNPEQLILNGWMTKSEAFFQKLIKRIHQCEDGRISTSVKASYWQEQGAAMGAATLGLHEFFKVKAVG